MTEQDYRADDVTDDGYCPKCGEPLTGLTVAARGYCDTHGWVFADWHTASGGDEAPRFDDASSYTTWTEVANAEREAAEREAVTDNEEDSP